MSLFDRLLEQQLLPTAKSNATFEERRQKWLAEALAKPAKNEPAPKQVDGVLPAPGVKPPVLLSEVHTPRPTPPPPEPLKLAGRPVVAVGQCKAINPATGQRCALLERHTKLHRHGSTEFRFGAEPDQKHFSRRAAIDVAATTRNPAGE